MPVLTDDEVGLGVLTDADVGLGKAESLGPPEPPQYEPETVAPVLTPPQREALAAEPMPPQLVMPPSTVRSTIAGGPPVPVETFAETIAEPIQVAEAMQERSMEPSIPLPRMESVAVRPPSLPERVLATVAGLGPTTVFGPNVPVSLGRGAVNLAIGVPEFATSPVGAATTILGGGATLAGKAGQIINRFIAAGFSADMIKSLYQQGKDTIQNWDKMTADEKAVAVESMAGTAGMAGVLGTHAFRGRRTAVPERKPPVVEEAKPAEPVPLAPEPAPAPPAEKALTSPAAGETVKGVTTEPYEKAPETTKRAGVPTLDRGQVELRGKALQARLREAQGLLTPQSKRDFGKSQLDLANKRLISEDGTWSLQYFAPGEAIPGGDIAGTKGSVVIVDLKRQQPAAPAAQAKETYAKVEKPETGQIPLERGEPAVTGAEGEAEAGTAQRGGADQARQAEVPLTPPAAEAAKPAAAETKPAVEPGQGGVPYYRKLGEQDALDPARKRMRSVPQNFKLAYIDGWYAAKKLKPAAPSTKTGEGLTPEATETLMAAPGSKVAGTPAGVSGVRETTETEAPAALGSPDVSVPVKAKRQEGGRATKILTQKEVDRLGTRYEDAKRIYGEHNLETQRRFQKWFEAAQARKQAMLARDMAKTKPTPPTPGAAAGGPELPSVGAASAAPGGIPPRAAIEQLADAFAGKAPTAERFAAFVRNAFNFGARGAKAKDALSAAVQGMKTSGTALWDSLTKFQTPDDLLKAKGDLSAELETRGWRVRQFVRNVQASVPDKTRRAAIAKWIDAGGDDAVLAAGEAATKPEYKQAYRDARNLTADEKIQAQNIQNYFDTRLQEAIDAGVLEHGLDDYIHRIYEKDPSLIKRALAYVQSGILSRNPALAKKRLFEFDWQAEQQGFRPVQDFLPRIATYEASLSRAIAARKFVQRMSELTAPDGRPIVGIKGVGVPLEDPVTGAREGTVIKPLGDFKKNRDESDVLNYRGDYEDREFPALSKWKWVSTDAGGKPIFVQGDVAIHPDYVKRVDALLKPSSVRKYAPLRTAQAISATVKQTMLDMSFFHQVQIAVHGLEHRVNPFRLVQEIDFENPNVQGLLKGGVTLGGEYYPSNLGEGLVGRSLTQHIPGLGQVLETYHGWLFQDFIPRMKLTMGLHALERNRQRYAADLASGRMSEDALYLLTAKQANAAFGELNYTMLERNKTVQDMARLMLLAPDFLEARGRFVAQALTKYGTEQRVALLLGAITMWTAARVMNKIADDQWHLEPENLFNLVWRNNAYGLRTVQGDVLHMLTKPIQFWTNRLNPVYGRTMMELLTQRDQFGRKRDMWEQLKDAISTVQPIATRSSRERHLWESLLNSFGVTARRWNDVKNAHELASKWKKENNIREQPGEFIYDSDKDPLRPLKLALSEQDDAGAVKELKRVLDRKVMTPEQVDKYFNRYAAAPFTGSRANDVRFMASLSADDKKTVQAAQQHRRAMLELYRKTRRQLQAATQPRPAMPAGVPLPAPVPLPPMFQP